MLILVFLCGLALLSPLRHQSTTLLAPFKHLAPFPCLQAELEELVKQEHARIDGQDQSSESTGAPAKASSASAAPQHKQGQE